MRYLLTPNPILSVSNVPRDRIFDLNTFFVGLAYSINLPVDIRIVQIRKGNEHISHLARAKKPLACQV